MSVGTSGTTAISSIKNKAHNLGPAIASTKINVHGSSSANFPGNIAENRQLSGLPRRTRLIQSHTFTNVGLRLGTKDVVIL